MCTDVSIVIVSWNVKDFLQQCLGSIFNETNGLTYEIFVVDNDSSDGTSDFIEQKFPSVRLIKNSENVGFAKANNQAIRRSSGKYVLLLNPDTLILDDAIVKTKLFLDSHPKAGMATCKILNPNRTIQECYAYNFPSLASLVFGGSTLGVAVNSLALTNRFFNEAGLSPTEYNHQHQVAWIMGAFMMVRREAIEKVGLLDENLFMYGEETDWCYRMKQRNWEVWYYPEGEVVHFGGQSTQQSTDEVSTSWLLETRHYFFRKHFGTRYMGLCYVTDLISTIIKLVIFFMLGLLPLQSKRADYVHYKIRMFRQFLRWYWQNSLFSLTKKSQRLELKAYD